MLGIDRFTFDEGPDFGCHCEEAQQEYPADFVGLGFAEGVSSVKTATCVRANLKSVSIILKQYLRDPQVGHRIPNHRQL